jgi:hypothetical protein
MPRQPKKPIANVVIPRRYRRWSDDERSAWVRSVIDLLVDARELEVYEDGDLI